MACASMEPGGNEVCRSSPGTPTRGYGSYSPRIAEYIVGEEFALSLQGVETVHHVLGAGVVVMDAKGPAHAMLPIQLCR